MCAFGMKDGDQYGEGYVYKPTKFMTNSWVLANSLNKFRCDGTHRRVQLLGGKAAKAAVYPDRLCSTICKGIRDQLEYDSFVSRMRFYDDREVF